MNPDQLFARYRELQEYVGWTDADTARINRLVEPLSTSFRAMVDDFYSEIQRHPRAMKVITGGAPQIGPEAPVGGAPVFLQPPLHPPSPGCTIVV